MPNIQMQKAGAGNVSVSIGPDPPLILALGITTLKIRQAYKI